VQGSPGPGLLAFEVLAPDVLVFPILAREVLVFHDGVDFGADQDDEPRDVQ
jgi:hypothetical protein